MDTKIDYAPGYKPENATPEEIQEHQEALQEIETELREAPVDTETFQTHGISLHVAEALAKMQEACDESGVPGMKVSYRTCETKEIRGMSQEVVYLDDNSGNWNDPDREAVFKAGRQSKSGIAGEFLEAPISDSPTHMHEGEGNACPMCVARDEDSQNIRQPKIIVDSATMDRLIAYQRAEKNRAKRDRRARRGK